MMVVASGCGIVAIGCWSVSSCTVVAGFEMVCVSLHLVFVVCSLCSLFAAVARGGDDAFHARLGLCSLFLFAVLIFTDFFFFFFFHLACPFNCRARSRSGKSTRKLNPALFSPHLQFGSHKQRLIRHSLMHSLPLPWHSTPTPKMDSTVLDPTMQQL